mmetsp:Transcript_5961/g.10145  ORF Transcript_5961/g.10145 Transcript_5961/m.10145 type:complete len:357 (+) Transcript_5961:1783-2853(+)
MLLTAAVGNLPRLVAAGAHVMVALATPMRDGTHRDGCVALVAYVFRFEGEFLKVMPLGAQQGGGCIPLALVLTGPALTLLAPLPTAMFQILAGRFVHVPEPKLPRRHQLRSCRGCCCIHDGCESLGFLPFLKGMLAIVGSKATPVQSDKERRRAHVLYAARADLLDPRELCSKGSIVLLHVREKMSALTCSSTGVTVLDAHNQTPAPVGVHTRRATVPFLTTAAATAATASITLETEISVLEKGTINHAVLGDGHGLEHDDGPYLGRHDTLLVVQGKRIAECAHLSQTMLGFASRCLLVQPTATTVIIAGDSGHGCVDVVVFVVVVAVNVIVDFGLHRGAPFNIVIVSKSVSSLRA